MPSRLAVALLLANVLPVQISYAQQTPCTPVSTEQVVSDVVISGAAFNDGYDDGICGVDGEIYRRHSDQHVSSVMRVARDGSTTVFDLPIDLRFAVVAPTNGGLNVLTLGKPQQMYRFDRQGKLLAHHQLSLVFTPAEMAVLPSGNTVVVGFRQLDDPTKLTSRFEGAVLNAEDQLVRGFDFPLTPSGDRWLPWMWGSLGKGMTAANAVAYVILQSKSMSSIATITETGHVDPKIVPVPPNSETRYHGSWMFGPGVAVEVYHDPIERPHPVDRFDEYDLVSGEKIATKSAPATGFAFGCYIGKEVSMLAHSADVDPARHLPAHTLRLVTSKLK